MEPKVDLRDAYETASEEMYIPQESEYDTEYVVEEVNTEHVFNDDKNQSQNEQRDIQK